MRERRRPNLRFRRQLLDARRSQPREVVGRPLQRRERRPSRLVRQRNGDLGSSGKRFQERPLGAREVFEAVGEDRPPLPGAQLAGQAFGRSAALEVPVPEADTIELGPVFGVETGEIAVEIARLDEPGLELAEGRRERVREAGVASRLGPAVQPRPREHPSHDEGPLRIGCDGPGPTWLPPRDAREQVVERPDLTTEQRTAGGQ